MSAPRTPSQTIGPFFGFGLPWPDGPTIVREGSPGAIRIFGRVLDGRGEPVPDALLETWQADASGRLGTPGFRGFARCPTGPDGGYVIVTLKPGGVQLLDGPQQAPPHAPYLAVSLFARGLLKRIVTRMYFADEAVANAADPVLAELDARARATLLAAAEPAGYRFDIHLQGEAETVVFETP